VITKFVATIHFVSCQLREATLKKFFLSQNRF